MDAKIKTALLGLAFISCLTLAYLENTIFFNSLEEIFANPLLSVGMVFIHNVLVISLILLGMTFYVEVVLNFLPKREIEHVVLDHPKIFALIFTAVILLISILRTCMLVYGAVEIQRLGLIILLSSPNGIIEAYGIYLTIKKTLKRTISTGDLTLIYGLFFIAAIMEVGFAQLLMHIVETSYH